eukprot:c22401_g1_i1 orf=272-1060(-)
MGRGKANMEITGYWGVCGLFRMELIGFSEHCGVLLETWICRCNPLWLGVEFFSRIDIGMYDQGGDIIRVREVAFTDSGPERPFVQEGFGQRRKQSAIWQGWVDGLNVYVRHLCTIVMQMTMAAERRRMINSDEKRNGAIGRMFLGCGVEDGNGVRGCDYMNLLVDRATYNCRIGESVSVLVYDGLLFLSMMDFCMNSTAEKEAVFMVGISCCSSMVLQDRHACKQFCSKEQFVRFLWKWSRFNCADDHEEYCSRGCSEAHVC